MADTPGACDDGDRCTEDLCAEGACLNPPHEGIHAVTCRLETIAADLRGAAPDDVGGPVAQARLDARIAAVLRVVGDVGEPGSARARGPLLRAARQLKSFGVMVARSGRRGKLRADLAARVLDRSNEAVSRLVSLARRP